MPNYLDYQKAMGLNWIHVSGFEDDTSKTSAYFKGSGVTIGVIDDGIESGHSDLTSNFLGRYSGLNISGCSCPCEGVDNFGLHGTHVAGIVAGAGAVEIYGVCPLSKVYDMPIISSEYSSSETLLVFKNSIEFAIENNIKVLNCSFVLTKDEIDDPVNAVVVSGLKVAIKDAYEDNIIICVAAGNNSSDVDYFGANGSSDIGTILNVKEYVLVAGSIYDIAVFQSSPFFNRTLNFSENVRRADFSSYGKRMIKNGMAAPGEQIYSSVPVNSYAVYDGTSMASPFIAGVAAMIIGFFQKAEISYTSQMVFKIIKACVFNVKYDSGPANVPTNIVYSASWGEKKIYIKGWNRHTGYGFINFELVSRVLMQMNRNGGQLPLTKQNLPEGKRTFDTLPAGWPDIGPPAFTKPATDPDFT